ncbi:alpha-D-ribose 1-methylphosphonate 5-triphosphate diphosphatase [Marimonas arenosa]|uniref:Alpha-D-ribose 1-methylphosphonate 5-triphosphate diphosphatase n=1 Tax=Marimonas arenosa TaxID=1795305 RepID=A0AAE4B4G8_9RHOB|nr:alpha-D-ribose 1-methylphosphonate 5-triphosphate diphosphatase [Marimonas arenosa]MDQ2090215.1 alpha-D-ribose 1-methylphosphonate 5-triphosphate diphosphatase [Marimonas arenosa]
MSLALTLEGAEILAPAGLAPGRLGFAEGVIADGPVGRAVDLSGYIVLPGIVDIHGDGFERHLAPRRGAMKDMAGGLVACEAELAANGVTTAVLAQFWSWEGGMRSPAFARAMLEALAEARPRVVTDLHAQLRFETHMLQDYDAFEDAVAEFGVGYVVFNDHLPHDRLAKGQRPKRLNGTALKSGRSPEVLLALMQALHARSGDVPAAVAGLAARLGRRGVRLGSHDDRTTATRVGWRGRGVTIAEFPETAEAAEAARAGGDGIVLGAPNVMRGGSHNGNASALDLIAMGLCDALASDYHYPSLWRAALFLEEAGACDLASAWALVSEGPARLLGLEDRGRLAPGQRADLVVLDAATRRIAATMSGGRVSYLSGDLAERFLSA